MIYISIEKASGVIRGMADDKGTLKSMIIDSKRLVRDYHIINLSDLDYDRWCEGKWRLDKQARDEYAKKVLGL